MDRNCALIAAEHYLTTNDRDIQHAIQTESKKMATSRGANVAQNVEEQPRTDMKKPDTRPGIPENPGGMQVVYF